jgi:hypothetical protein
MSDELDKELEPQKTEDDAKEKEAVKGKEKEDVKALDVEALKKALSEELAEKIRKEEKDKLYASFEKYKEDAKKAADEKAAAEAKLKEYETKNLSVEEQATLRFQELQEANNKLTEQLNTIVTTANDRINTLELELTKKELLSAYNDEIIVDMVTGNSLEELRQNAEKAHREYKAIEEKTQAKLAVKEKSPIGTGLNPPSSDKLNASPTIADINKVTDPKEWEKLKNKFLEDALKQQ